MRLSIRTALSNGRSRSSKYVAVAHINPALRCRILIHSLQTALEKGSDETKVETMKRILGVMLNGNSLTDLLMHIIRFVMPSKSKPLKKLLYL
jgi:vesicle coat complex subunit